MAELERRTAPVLGVPIDVIDWQAALDRLMAWGAARASRYVTICNAHVVVTASRDANYHRVIASSDMATPDGAPVAWMLRRLADPNQPKISGPDLMHELLKTCASRGVSVYFFGSSPETLARLNAAVELNYPGLNVAGSCSPPFRAATDEEDAQQVLDINSSGAGLVFVGLGCPKQERWMAEHRGRVNAVMLGVGAAFDFHAGTVSRAPHWMHRNGLEWLHRLASEPRRLWKRYLVTTTLFVVGAVRQLATR
jgi:N-acetylglucosaminyldiphosphoundecaprenol N-acetyl-beta-D-mannosaminyltransferase